jgi:hypothetical protein
MAAALGVVEPTGLPNGVRSGSVIEEEGATAVGNRGDGRFGKAFPLSGSLRPAQCGQRNFGPSDMQMLERLGIDPTQVSAPGSCDPVSSPVVAYPPRYT